MGGIVAFEVGGAFIKKKNAKSPFRISDSHKSYTTNDS